jgi:excisionase family DNA binding protein
MSNNHIEKPEWFTIKEAAHYLQIGEPTLYRWMRDNKITFRKVGDSTRFLQQDLDAVIVVHHAAKSLKSDTRCQSCGSTNLIDGKCQSTGNLYFVPEKAKFWTLKTSTVNMKSSMCGRCGLVNFIGNTSHLKELMQKQDEEKKS